MMREPHRSRLGPIPDPDSRVFYEPNTGCHLWCGMQTSSRGGAPYGIVVVLRRKVRAHVFFWERAHGPVPNGLELDHLCRQTLCVNDEHLEPVTRRVNALRGIGASAINAKKTHCVHGHLFAGPNLIIVSRPYRLDERRCRACDNSQSRKNYLRRRAQSKTT